MVVVVVVVVVVARGPAAVDEALLAVLVVDLALLVVDEDLVGLGEFAEACRRLLLVVRVLVRVPAQRQLSISKSNENQKKNTSDSVG